ncbi:hypothetical protein P7L70_01695 (plasmid) [Tistrella mobilis]|uniref:hypothetical protein n=1 Tax=Tistrella mobilis TaxID=171437 RepID=UPI0035561759
MTNNDLLSLKLSRIEFWSKHTESELGRNLLNAYTACLTTMELCTATLRYLDGDQAIVRAFRTRLIRIGRDGSDTHELDQLSTDLIAQPARGRRIGPRTDGLLSSIYPYLSVTARKNILEYWIDQKTKNFTNRWLKAMAKDDFLRDIDLIWDEWRRSYDAAAARIFVEHATEARITQALPILITEIEEGWLVSRAALKASLITHDCWHAIRQRFPATYAYLCARLGRALDEAEALAIVAETIGDPYGDRGLAIWSIGQMKMVDILDKISTTYVVMNSKI